MRLPDAGWEGETSYSKYKCVYCFQKILTVHRLHLQVRSDSSVASVVASCSPLHLVGLAHDSSVVLVRGDSSQLYGAWLALGAVKCDVGRELPSRCNLHGPVTSRTGDGVPRGTDTLFTSGVVG